MIFSELKRKIIPSYKFFKFVSHKILVPKGPYLKASLNGSDVRLYDGPDIKLFILVGWGRSFFLLAQRGSTGDFLLLRS